MNVRDYYDNPTQAVEESNGDQGEQSGCRNGHCVRNRKQIYVNVLSQTLNRHLTDVSSFPFPLPPSQSSSQILSMGPDELSMKICPFLGSFRGEVMFDVGLVPVLTQARATAPAAVS